MVHARFGSGTALLHLGRRLARNHAVIYDLGSSFRRWTVDFDGAATIGRKFGDLSADPLLRHSCGGQTAKLAASHVLIAVRSSKRD